MKHDVFVCSAFGDVPENLVYARKYCRWVMEQDEDANPFAPHLFYTQFLENTNKDDWQKGFNLGLARLAKSSKMYVFVRHGLITPGMLKEIKSSFDAGPPIIWFDSTDPENILELKHLAGVLTIPAKNQLLAPKPFATEAIKQLDSIAEALKNGAQYEDLQGMLESFLGPVDASEKDEELDEAWERARRF